MFKKKLLLLFIASIVALLFSELVVARVIGYPAYGVEYKALYMPGSSKWINIRKPHAKIFNVEGKTITSVNNLGLPGLDIDTLDNPIVLLGSSFVEAFQYQPEEIASSLFWKVLAESDSDRTVLNLGCSGHDPYNSWFRTLLFSDILQFNAEDIILILNSDNQAWFNRHAKPFTFVKPKHFGSKNTSPYMRIGTMARNTSSLVEILYKGLLKGEDEVDNPSHEHIIDEKISASAPDYSLSQEMKDCFDAFAKEYDGFMVLSIAGDLQFNTALSFYCDELDIPYLVNPLDNPRYMINGAGHLNKEGNVALAEALMTLWKKEHKEL